MTTANLRRLGDVIEVKHGFAFDGKHFCDSGPYRLLTPGNFAESGGFVDRGDKQKHYDGPVPKDFVLAPGALLVAMTEQAEGLLGSSAMVPSDGKPCLHNQRLGLVRPISGADVDLRYIYYVFNTPGVRRQIRATASGTKIRHTAPSRIAAATAYIPRLALQRRIASILGTYDDLVEVNRRRIAVLEEMARRLFEEWFVRFRFPGQDCSSEPGEPLAFSTLPHGWRIAKLVEVFNFRSGSTIDAEDRTEGAVPVHGANGIIGLTKRPPISQRCIVLGKIGSCGAMHRADEAVFVTNNAYAVEPALSPDDFEFMAQALRLVPWRQYVGGAANPYMPVKSFSSHEIVLPPDSLRASFGRAVAPLALLCHSLRRANQLLVASRDMLLPRLISGDLAVAATERELESVA